MRVVNAVGEPLVVHGIAKGRELVDRVAGLLERVGLGAGDLYKFSTSSPAARRSASASPGRSPPTRT